MAVLDFSRNEQADRSDRDEGSDGGHGAFERVAAVVRRAHGLDLRHYRYPVLQRRLEARLQRLGLRNLDEYLAYLDANPEEPDRLLRHLMIKASRFLRERSALTVVRDVVFGGHDGRAAPLRVWSAGCGNGEEPYSLSLVASTMERPVELSVLATDVDDSALATARAARYPDWVLGELGETEIARFFEHDPSLGDRGRPYVLREPFRRGVRFEHLDLLGDSVPDGGSGPFDLVVCRNVLIYLTRKAQEAVQVRLRDRLARGGHLWLGEAEVLCRALGHEFEEIDKKARLYRLR